jgi:hypothetical protein
MIDYKQMQTMTIEPNKSFVWPKGLRLVSNENVTIVLPGALIRNGEQIGTILKTSDGTEIGFEESKNPDELFTRIILKVSKGNEICINRATQAMLVCESELPITFQVED